MNSLVFADRLSQQAKKFVVQNAKEENAKQRIALGDDQQAAEDDADMTAAIDADCDNCFHFTTEKSLVMANILGEFHPIIALVVANQSNKFSNQLLRETSILALCKYMCVSSVLCEKYLPLLFTALENETVEACRTTIMLAFGDLMLRFPNSMEAWTPLMYARLSDDKVVVRYNVLMVLTHLILNDMVKVKGQVAHVVMCLTDSEPKIKDMAHTFFIKLSERSNNPVYNLLGDIIGVISRETQSKELNAREFQATMHFLLSFVKKDKQADSMLERLVVRLSVAQSLRQRRSLAFCISELSVTEKGVKKMAEMIRSIKDALYDEEVFEYVLKTVQSAKKDSAKGSADEKKIVDELEQTLMAINRDAHGEEVVEGSQENAWGENTAPKNAEKEKDEFSLRDPTKPAAKVAKGAKNPSKKAARKPKKKAVESESEDEEESDCDEVEMDETPVVAKSSSRAGRGRKVLGERSAYGPTACFRRFLLDTFGLDTLQGGSGVADVAGGAGTLSFELQNLNNIPSTVYDPRQPCFKRGRKSVSHRRRQAETGNRALSYDTAAARGDELIEKEQLPAWAEVWFGRWLWEECEEANDDGIFKASSYKKDAKEVDRWQNATTDDERLVALDPDDVSRNLNDCSVVLGLHPDGATDAIVDFALTKGKPFAILPCCVYNKHFTSRRTAAGRPVRTHAELVDYLQAKHSGIQRVELDCDGRNVCLFWKGNAK
eukprot:GSChrysophyteH2.ASY1.ANO1.1321.1 assembled CDS